LLYNLNSQYGLLYQGIQDYNKDLIWRSVDIFAAIAGLLVLITGYATYFSNKLAFGIREGLTDFYTRSIDSYFVPNLEQRVQEDLKKFGEYSVDFWLTILKAIVKLPLFLSVIITLTSWYIGLTIIFAVVMGTWLTKVISTKLVKLQIVQESNEANFRSAIRGHHNILTRWVRIKAYFLDINKQIKKLTFLQSGLGQIFVLLPFIILLPLYIAKTISMGAFFQSVNALSKVIDSLTVIIDNRQLIVNIQTVIGRMEVLKCSNTTQ